MRRQEFFDTRGHAVNRAGPWNRLSIPAPFGNMAHLITFLRPGSILAHQDWMRMKCGAGLAVATGICHREVPPKATHWIEAVYPLLSASISIRYSKCAGGAYKVSGNRRVGSRLCSGNPRRVLVRPGSVAEKLGA